MEMTKVPVIEEIISISGPDSTSQTNSPANNEKIPSFPMDIQSCFPPRCDSDDDSGSYEITFHINRSWSIESLYPPYQSSESEDESYPNEQISQNRMEPRMSLYIMKAVFKVTMDGHKSCSKAMKIVVGISGVESASLKGQDKDQIEVTGEGFDPVKLATLLRKNLGHADLLSVSSVEENKVEQLVHPMVWQGTVPLEDYYHYQYPTSVAEPRYEEGGS